MVGPPSSFRCYGGEVTQAIQEKTGISSTGALRVDVIMEKAMMEMLSGSSTFDVISLSTRLGATI